MIIIIIVIVIMSFIVGFKIIIGITILLVESVISDFDDF